MAPVRILLTGGQGFVGRHLCATVAKRWPAAEVTHLTEDLRNHDAVSAAVAAAKPDTILHLAAQASVASSLTDSAETWAINAAGTLNLATAVARHVPEAMTLFTSSSEVYGASFLRGTVDETTPLLPLTPYAKSKAAAERLLAEALPPNARLIVVRPFNHTGVGQREAFVLPSFAGQIAAIESGRKEPRLDVGNLDVVRDILDVSDVVEAYLQLIDAATRLPLRFTGLVASGAARPLRDHVELLRGMAKVKFEIVVDPARQRPVDIPVAKGDASLLQAVTGWKPRVSIEATLRGLLEAARSAA